jgi:uncharacterized membrane protein
VTNPARRGSGSAPWLPAALLALSLVPIVSGSARLVELAGGPAVLPARFDPSSVPLAVHIVSVIVYAVLGAFQFSARLRRRRIGWHRKAGRLLVVAGLAVALSAVWMTLFYPLSDGGNMLFVFRLLAASGMVVSIVLGFRAIRRRDIPQHRAWMTRAYAIALGAGTQVFTLGIGKAIVGSSDLSIALLQAAAWVINLAVAERFIRRQLVHRPARAVVMAR